MLSAAGCAITCISQAHSVYPFDWGGGGHQPSALGKVHDCSGTPPLQFIRGISEPTVPDVKLTRAKDGSSGTATFVFAEPSVFEASEDLGDITGLYMRDAEGELSTVDVQVARLCCAFLETGLNTCGTRRASCPPSTCRLPASAVLSSKLA